jgi:acetylornithine deacetylase/succinyl-diaminopimelate desuccinylase-like protein
MNEAIRPGSDTQQAASPAPELSVVVPTFNERDNVTVLYRRLEAALAGIAWEVVFVDDNSPDGTTDAVRDACIADVQAELERICERRGVHYTLEEAMRAAAAPSDPAWQARWERAVEAGGVLVHRMPSGAGHDAMKLHEVMPQAMLFVRGGNSGISHNPLETITTHDAQLCVEAFQHLLDHLETT